MKISIVMPSFNQGAYVEAALESALAQCGAAIELIFVDGGSTDDTMDKVRKYRKHLAHCISEPDQGQSDALSKGFSLATGDFLTWLNTDDLLLPGAISDLARSSAASPAREWFMGNVVWIDAHDRILRARRGEQYRELRPRLGLLTAAGPSAFFSRKLYEKVGGVNKRLHYQMDTELWWRFIFAGAPFGRLRDYTWALRLHPAAKVSGAMFRNEWDPQSIAFHETRSRELEHVKSVTASRQVDIDSFNYRILTKILRITSKSYIRGLYESYMWKGSMISDIFKKS